MGLYDPAKTPGRKPPVEAEIPAGPGGCLAANLGTQVADMGNLVEALDENVLTVKEDTTAILDRIGENDLPPETGLNTVTGLLQSVHSISEGSNNYLALSLGGPENDGETVHVKLDGLAAKLPVGTGVLSAKLDQLLAGTGGFFGWVSSAVFNPGNAPVVAGDYNTVVGNGCELGRFSNGIAGGCILVRAREATGSLAGVQAVPFNQNTSFSGAFGGSFYVYATGSSGNTIGLYVGVTSTATAACHVDVVAMNDDGQILIASVLLQP